MRTFLHTLCKMIFHGFFTSMASEQAQNSSLSAQLVWRTNTDLSEKVWLFPLLYVKLLSETPIWPTARNWNIFTEFGGFYLWLSLLLTVNR